MKKLKTENEKLSNMHEDLIKAKHSAEAKFEALESKS